MAIGLERVLERDKILLLLLAGDGVPQSNGDTVDSLSGEADTARDNWDILVVFVFSLAFLNENQSIQRQWVMAGL